MGRAADLWGFLRSRWSGEPSPAPATPATVAGREPTAEEVIARHLAALGGADRLRALRSLRMTGRITGGELYRGAMTVVKKRPARYCRRLGAGSDLAIQAVDGEVAWGAGEKIGFSRPAPFSRKAARRLK